MILDQEMFSLFVKYNLVRMGLIQFDLQNNLILFFETVETLLDMVVSQEFTRSLERFENNCGGRNYGKFPQDYSTHVHQICLTYLVDTAPYKLGLDSLEILKVVKGAKTPTIPLNLFDDLLQLVLEDLFLNCYPNFLSSFRLPRGALDYLDVTEERDVLPRGGSYEQDFPIKNSYTVDGLYAGELIVDGNTLEECQDYFPTDSILRKYPSNQVSDYEQSIDYSTDPQSSLQSHSSILMAMEDAVYSDIDYSESFSRPSSRNKSVNHSRSSSARSEDDLDSLAPWNSHSKPIRPPVLRQSRGLSTLYEDQSKVLSPLPENELEFKAVSKARTSTNSHLARSRLEQNRLNAKLASFVDPPSVLLKSPVDLEICENLDFNVDRRRSSRISFLCDAVPAHFNDADRSSQRLSGCDKGILSRPNITVTPPQLTVNTKNVRTSSGLPTPLPSAEFDVEMYYYPSETITIVPEKKGWKKSFKSAIKNYFHSH
jgi:hypothetical protein